MVFVKSTDEWSFGARLMQAIASDAERIRYPVNDRHYDLGLTEIWLCPQVELDNYNQPYMTWWIRWVDKGSSSPLASMHCLNLLSVIAAVADILDRAKIAI